MEDGITRISVSNFSASLMRKAIAHIRANEKYIFTFEEKPSDRTTLFEIKCEDPLFFFVLGKLYSKYYHQL